MSTESVADEALDERLQRIRRRAALTAARLQRHTGRCAICGAGRGLYGGLCLLGSGLRRESDAARRVLDGLQTAPPTL